MVSTDGEDDREYPDVGAIYTLGQADFRSGYPRSWTPHLGGLSSDEIAWSLWLSGWDDAYAQHESFMLAVHKAIHKK